MNRYFQGGHKKIPTNKTVSILISLNTAFFALFPRIHSDKDNKIIT